jgi:hypothetical protein
MDDFNVASLHESKNEWGSRLLTILTPLVVEGLRSIFDEATSLCNANNEMDKYLMTFQNFISRIPKWNPTIIETERVRIVERSGCAYLDDLVTCVHIIQLKLLTAIRVGQKQKKVDITIPKLDDFIHKVYINVARKVYKNVYLFELHIPPLQVQKNHRELEVIVQECILNTVRESIPVEAILKAYMDETVEEDVVEEVKEEVIETVPEPVTQTISETTTPTPAPAPTPLEEEPPLSDAAGAVYAAAALEHDKTSFPDFPDFADDGASSVADSESAGGGFNIDDYLNDGMSQFSDDDGRGPKLNIKDEEFRLDNLDVHVLDEPPIKLNNDDLLLSDIEVLS